MRIWTNGRSAAKTTVEVDENQPDDGTDEESPADSTEEETPADSTEEETPTDDSAIGDGDNNEGAVDESTAGVGDQGFEITDLETPMADVGPSTGTGDEKLECSVSALEESAVSDVIDQPPVEDPAPEASSTPDLENEEAVTSPARNGSPAVGDGLRRGTVPGQAEDATSARPSGVARPAVVVLAVCALLGLLAGAGRGSEEIVRRELVYTLDESVPDSFLREDRRLLTQVVTMQSDAVLVPVAEQHDLTLDELRGRIDVETVDLSEVLQLDVRAPDRATAQSISDAVIDQYLVVSTAGTPAGDSDALLVRRAEITAELDAVEAQLSDLAASETEDARLQTSEESLEGQIELARLQLDRLQGLLDDALVDPTVAARQSALRTELAATETELFALESELAEVRVDRAELSNAATAEPSLTRRVARLETDLTTIDDELASRELGPLVAAPIRELGTPTFASRSVIAAGVQGLAVGALIGIPLAALAALAVHRRRRWRT